MTIKCVPNLLHVEHACAEHAVMTDDGMQVITRTFGRATDWHFIAIINPETDELLTLDVHALDSGGEAEPYRTNATINGQALVYDPRCRRSFAVSNPDAYEAAVRVFPPAETQAVASETEASHVG